MHSALQRDVRLGTHVFDWDAKGKNVATEVALGLHYLHCSRVIHRYVDTLQAEGMHACKLAVCYAWWASGVPVHFRCRPEVGTSI